MAAGQKLYPRATVKKIVKAHSKRNVSKNVDVLVGLSTRLPVQQLIGLCRFSSIMRSSYKRTRFYRYSMHLWDIYAGYCADNDAQVDEGSYHQRETGW
jgi:hypothetical protein